MFKILSSPLEFKNVLLSKIKTSDLTCLNCLYIGNAEYREILDNSRGKIELGLDYYRGNRDRLKRDARVQFHFFKSPNYQELSQILPRRWNETLGTFHVKGFVLDNDVILSGANLSTDYFGNRQDRYFLEFLKIGILYLVIQNWLLFIETYLNHFKKFLIL